jgi:DNA-binding NtrC family response regulator
VQSGEGRVLALGRPARNGGAVAAGPLSDQVLRQLVDAVTRDPTLAVRLRQMLEQVEQGARAEPAESAPQTVSQLSVERLAAEAPVEPAEEPYMVGSSPLMLTIFENIRKFSRCDAPVLITGESGTGKELAARAIHERSARGAGPFVAINCAALPPTLIASELFGYEKGAFTGANARKIGRIEAARGGTLFLDEIGDLSLDLQGHLLRFLQEKMIERVGGNQPIEIDVRVIAATHVDLRLAMKEGRFREDLFYRLNVLTLHVPALRERGDDLILLAKYFLQKFREETKSQAQEFDDGALQAIIQHSWPGNIRELIACIRRGVVLASGPYVTVDDLGIVSGLVQPGAASAPRIKPRDIDASFLREVLMRNRFNVKRSAQELQVSRMTLYRLMHRHGI